MYIRDAATPQECPASPPRAYLCTTYYTSVQPRTEVYEACVAAAAAAAAASYRADKDGLKLAPCHGINRLEELGISLRLFLSLSLDPRRLRALRCLFSRENAPRTCVPVPEFVSFSTRVYRCARVRRGTGTGEPRVTRGRGELGEEGARARGEDGARTDECR